MLAWSALDFETQLIRRLPEAVQEDGQALIAACSIIFTLIADLCLIQSTSSLLGHAIMGGSDAAAEWFMTGLAVSMWVVVCGCPIVHPYGPTGRQLTKGSTCTAYGRVAKIVARSLEP